MIISSVIRGLFANTAASLFMLSVVTASGCATTKALRPPEAAGNGKALVYFIRKRYPPYVREVRLSVNDEPVATLANNDFVAVNVPVGVKNSVYVDVTDGPDLSFNLPVEKADKLYVVLTGSVEKTGASAAYNELTIYLDWNLWASPVSAAEAQSIIAGFGKRLE